MANPSAVAIVGSYRRGGAVDSAVALVVSGLEARGVACRTEYLRDLRIEFCTNCRSCLQSPGPERGRCVLQDDMGPLLDRIGAADLLVLGSPTNAGGVNALTQRFIERCVCLAHWPWGAHAPVLRDKTRGKRSVLVSASGAPAVIGRYLNGTLRSLKTVSRYLGARPVGTLWVGGVVDREVALSPKIARRARALADRMATG